LARPAQPSRVRPISTTLHDPAHRRSGVTGFACATMPSAGPDDHPERRRPGQLRNSGTMEPAVPASRRMHAPSRLEPRPVAERDRIV
jgi:hypothetical protein